MLAPTSPPDGGCPVLVDPQDDASKVCIVWFGTAELIVRHSWTKWAVGQVLHLTTPAVVTNHDVEFAVWTESKDSPIVIAACCLSSILLNRTKSDDVVIEYKVRPIPQKAIDSIAE
jgi:hypothetical protein